LISFSHYARIVLELLDRTFQDRQYVKILPPLRLRKREAMIDVTQHSMSDKICKIHSEAFIKIHIRGQDGSSLNPPLTIHAQA